VSAIISKQDPSADPTELPGLISFVSNAEAQIALFFPEEFLRINMIAAHLADYQSLQVKMCRGYYPIIF
jgi:hypothetical protein